MITVIKRDNTIQTYDIIKIKNAVLKSCSSTPDNGDLEELLTKIDRCIKDKYTEISIEQIQDIVEKCMMETKIFGDEAKAYIIYRNYRKIQREKYGYDVTKICSNKEPKFINDYGYIVFKRTYARLLDNNITEEFKDMVQRVLSGSQTQLNCNFTNNELNRLFEYMMDFKGLPAGRFLWQLGSPTVNDLGLMSLQNCAFTIIDCIEAFTWMFDTLLLGTGVGVNIQRKNILKLPPVLNKAITITRQDDKSASFIVPDTREGWVELLDKVLLSYFVNGKSFTYSTMLVRSEGTPLKKFGGVAAGPEPLCNCIALICDTLNGACGRNLSSVEVLDIVTILGQCVSNGAIRRSAIITLGDHDDIEFLRSKDWNTSDIPNHRSMSNNSIICNDINDLPKEYWDNFYNDGELFGLINMDLSKKTGRIIDGNKYPDPEVEGVNPCGEITIPNRATCCLTELFLCNIQSFEELKDVATLLYRICKHSITLPCHQKTTEDIVHRQMRIGISVTGVAQASEEQKGWLNGLYEYLREYDVMYSNKNGFPYSVKLTTCKPSGTLSSMAGCTSGIHPAVYKIFQRRIRINSSNPITKICKKHGYPSEYQINFDGTYDNNTTIISFPCKYPDGTKDAATMGAIEMLEEVKWMQTYWSDNAVSVTVYYKKDEVPAIKQWLLENYNDNIKSVSFLLHNEHGFKQAPYEEITLEEYNTMISKCKKITSMRCNTYDNNVDMSSECVGGVCPVR